MPNGIILSICFLDAVIETPVICVLCPLGCGDKRFIYDCQGLFYTFFMNTLEIIKRIKISCGYKSDAELARTLGLSPQNFNSQKKTGKIKDSLILHAVDKGVNKDWIRTGKGEMYTVPGIYEHNSSYDDRQESKALIADIIKGQAEAIRELQKTTNALHSKNSDLHKEIHDLHKEIHDLGAEIGEIKTNMIKTALSGDITRLGILTVKGPTLAN